MDAAGRAGDVLYIKLAIIVTGKHYIYCTHELKVLPFLNDPKELNTDFMDLHRFTQINYKKMGLSKNGSFEKSVVDKLLDLCIKDLQFSVMQNPNFSLQL